MVLMATFKILFLSIVLFFIIYFLKIVFRFKDLVYIFPTFFINKYLAERKNKEIIADYAKNSRNLLQVSGFFVPLRLQLQ